MTVNLRRQSIPKCPILSARKTQKNLNLSNLPPFNPISTPPLLLSPIPTTLTIYYSTTINNTPEQAPPTHHYSRSLTFRKLTTRKAGLPWSGSTYASTALLATW